MPNNTHDVNVVSPQTTKLEKHAPHNSSDTRDKFSSNIVEHICEAVVLIKDDGKSILYANPVCNNLFGYRPHELTGQHVSILWASDKTGRARGQRIFETLDQRGGFEGELPGLTSEGVTFPCQVSVISMGHQEFGRVWLLIAENITESTIVRSREQGADDRFRLLVERMTDGVSTLDRSGAITFVNSRICQMFGYTREEMLGRKPVDLLDEENGKAFLRNFSDRRKGGNSQFEIQARRKNGQTFEMQITPQPLFDERGSFSGSLNVLRDITEHKKSEHALRESEERLRRQAEELALLYHTAPVGLCMIDTDLQFLRINERMALINGSPIEEHLGKRVRQIIPELGDEVEAVYRAVRDKGESLTNVEFHGVTPAHPDEERDFVCSYYPLKTAEGKVFALSTVVLDVTEQKRTENALRESEAKFHAIFDCAAVAMTIVDSNKRIVEVNRAMCEMLEYAEEELIGKTFLDITMEEDRDISLERYNSLLRSDDETLHIEKRYRKSDGSILWGLVAASRFKDRKSESFGIGIVQDITERKRAETALRDSEERLRQLVENLNEFVYLFDVSKMKAVYSSPAYEKIYGRDRDLLVNDPQDWKHAIHPEDVDDVMLGFERMVKDESADMVYRVVHPDRSIHWVHDRCFPIYDEAGELTLFAGVAEDITGRKAREDRIERQNRRLRKLVEERSRQAINSERLASVGRLTAGYTHEIRNPLQSMFCNLDRIAALTSGNSPAFREINSMRGHLQRIADVTKQLSFVHRPQESKITDFDVNDIITEAIDLYFSQMSDAGIEISLDLCQPTAFASADETVVYTALGNLILNATDAMQNGGRLQIKTSIHDGKVELCVSDSGTGISPEILQRIFEPFFTTKSPDQGTGLGLTLAKESLENFGGQIHAASEPGSGALFTILLPIAKTPE